jgi:hypothetical protein
LYTTIHSVDISRATYQFYAILNKFCKFYGAPYYKNGPGSVVGIATGYVLDGPGIESRWGRDLPYLSRPTWGPPSLLYNGYRVFPGVKSGRNVTLTPHPLLVPWSRKSRAITSTSIMGLRPVQTLSACKRVHFYITSALRWTLFWGLQRWPDDGQMTETCCHNKQISKYCFVWRKPKLCCFLKLGRFPWPARRRAQNHMFHFAVCKTGFTCPGVAFSWCL